MWDPGPGFRSFQETGSRTDSAGMNLDAFQKTMTGKTQDEVLTR